MASIYSDVFIFAFMVKQFLVGYHTVNIMGSKEEK